MVFSCFKNDCSIEDPAAVPAEEYSAMNQLMSKAVHFLQSPHF